MHDRLCELEGQRVAIWCMRYCYRGIVTKVNEDSVLLTDVYAVESAGSSMAKKVESEDQMPHPILVNYGAIEIVCQPNWA